MVLQGFAHLYGHLGIWQGEPSARYEPDAGAFQPGHAEELFLHSHGQHLSSLTAAIV